MAFPLTHLYVANRVLSKLPSPFPELFLLGAIAPDAVHFRTEFLTAAQSNIGPAKKITHLCPVSDEKWGHITDNDGWIKCVKSFLRANPNDSLVLGYAAHVLTDIYNNIKLWRSFVIKYPEIAAMGYKSDYYKDLRTIDLRIYKEFFKDSETENLLQQAVPRDIHGLTTADELTAIKHSLLFDSYTNVPENVETDTCFYVTYEQTLEFIQDAAGFCVSIFSEL